jgi:hypothetical protein
MINYKTMQKSNIMPTLKQLYINSHVPCQAHYYGVVSVRGALHPFLFMPMSGDQ